MGVKSSEPPLTRSCGLLELEVEWLVTSEMDRPTNGCGKGDFVYVGGAVRRARPLSLEFDTGRPKVVGCS